MLKDSNYELNCLYTIFWTYIFSFTLDLYISLMLYCILISKLYVHTSKHLYVFFADFRAQPYYMDVPEFCWAYRFRFGVSNGMWWWSSWQHEEIIGWEFKSPKNIEKRWAESTFVLLWHPPWCVYIIWERTIYYGLEKPIIIYCARVPRVCFSCFA